MSMDIWKHGTYVDTWSVVHFLSGFILAGLCYLVGFGFMYALGVSVAILFLWEAFEWLIRIIEPSVNVLVDLLVGVIGFLVGASIYHFLSVPLGLHFYAIIIVAVCLSVWGVS